MKQASWTVLRRGKIAKERLQEITTRAEGTLDWLYTASAPRNDGVAARGSDNKSLATWLSGGQGLFWITERPGSGKSTAMKHVFEDSSTLDYLNGHGSSSSHSTQQIASRLVLFLTGVEGNLKRSNRIANFGCRGAGWCRIGLFITNRGSPEQSEWLTMLQRVLLQLLKACPGLVRDSRSLLLKRTHKTEDPTKSFDLSQTMMENALMNCKMRSTPPFKALIVLDGTDELAKDTDFRHVVQFLKSLTDDSTPMANIFKVCISSRSEQIFCDLFFGMWRTEIHEHTRGDILRHVIFSRNECFRGMMRGEVEAKLKSLLHYITDNAHGVFLWAHSVASLADDDLRNGRPLEEVYRRVEGLPTEMIDLYTHILRGIPETLRHEAYIMLEVILHTQRPLTLLGLSLIIYAAKEGLEGRMAPRSSTPNFSIPDIGDFGDPLRLQRNLMASCKCLLELSPKDRFFENPWAKKYSRSKTSFLKTTFRDTETNVSSDEPRDPSRGLLQRSETGSVDKNTDHHLSEREGCDFSDQPHDPPAAGSESERNGNVELTRHQYQEHHEHWTLDPARCAVRLLHRSARDFLLDPKCLDSLFPSELGQPKPLANGHVYILFFVRAWLQLPRNGRKKLQCGLTGFATYETVVFHAGRLGHRMGPTNASMPTFFPLLDDIDRQLTRHSETRMDCWPADFIYNINLLDESGYVYRWQLTFPALAVANDMRGYIDYRIRKSEEDGDWDFFLNGKEGRPLLHFSVDMPSGSPKPEMARFLLQQGAKIGAKFERKTAIESLKLHKTLRTGEPHLSLLKVLLEGGADPSSRYFPGDDDGGNGSKWCPHSRSRPCFLDRHWAPHQPYEAAVAPRGQLEWERLVWGKLSRDFLLEVW